MAIWRCPLISPLYPEAPSLRRGEWDEVVSEHKLLEWSHGKKDRECYFQNVHNDLVSSNWCYEETKKKKKIINLFQIPHWKHVCMYTHANTKGILTSNPEILPPPNAVFVMTNLKFTTGLSLHKNLLWTDKGLWGWKGQSLGLKPRFKTEVWH